jgi:hypothetical protein
MHLRTGTGNLYDYPFYQIPEKSTVTVQKQSSYKNKGRGNIQMENNKGAFYYTYSAKQQEEIEKIRQKYIPKEENKMDQLRKLDESVTRAGTIAALALGIVSALVLGVGMCCSMVWADRYFVPGILLGLIGIAGAIAAYPLYNHITAKKREQIAPQIIRLTEELSGGSGRMG